MKIYGALLALTSLYAADAFAPSAFGAPRRATVLASSRPDSQQSTGPASAGAAQSMDAYTQSLQQSSYGSPRQAGRPTPGPMNRSGPMSRQSSTRSRPSESRSRRSFDATAPVPVQGGSLKTWSLRSPRIEQVQVVLKTEGRPLDADVDLWHGPDNTPQKMRVYVEDGAKRPFSAVIQTPRGPNTVSVRNIGQMEFPIEAFVVPNPDVDVLGAAVNGISNGFDEVPRTIQGGALKTYPFESNVQSVQVMLKTDGRPLNARIELLQGPNNNKQVMELYIEDGMDRPFFAVIETPGSGNVVRVVNTATVEFPLSASVLPYEISDYGGEEDIVVGGDSPSFSRDMQW